MEYVEVALNDLAPGTIVPVSLLYNTREVTGLVLRNDDAVAVYLDLCPHNKVVLSESGKYLTEDGNRIKCEAHGATFTLDGTCDKGPCSGDTLAKIPFEVIAESVRIPKQLAEG
jgi:nitrite reductase/ring-hydroxylating ferredoxin subunit